MQDKIERALRRPSRPTDRLVSLGLWAIGAVAIFTSWAGWTGLAELVGWTQVLHVHYPWIGGGIDLHASWGFGIAVDIFAVIAVQTWMSTDLLSQHTRDVARNWAVGAIGMGWTANALFHTLNSSDEPWYIKAIIVMLSAVPSVMAGVVVHLGVLRANDRRQTPAETTAPAARETRGPWLLRTVGAARDLVSLFRAEEAAGPAPTAQEARGVPPARSAADQPSSAPRRLTLVDGSRTQRMRDYYIEHRAQGIRLTGGQLDKEFGTNNYGRRLIKKIEAELEEPDAKELSS
jgi:hypothetical protein